MLLFCIGRVALEL